VRYTTRARLREKPPCIAGDGGKKGKKKKVGNHRASLYRIEKNSLFGNSRSQASRREIWAKNKEKKGGEHATLKLEGGRLRNLVSDANRKALKGEGVGKKRGKGRTYFKGKDTLFLRA